MEGRLEAPGGHLDTVRALHQTVVSLRTALELSKNELKELKEKYQRHSNCLDYTDVIEKLTLENHILRRRIIDSNYEEQDSNTKNITLEVTYSPRQDVEDLVESEVVIKTATTEVGSTAESLEPDPVDSEGHKYCSTENLNEIAEESESSELNVTADFTQNEPLDKESPVELDSQVISFSHPVEDQPTFRTKLELLSKFDVRIKVRTIKEGTVVSSTTSDSESTADEKKDTAEKRETESRNFHFEEKHINIETVEGSESKVDLKKESTENIKMAFPNEADVKTKPDKFDVQVRITSEENLTVKENIERSRRKDTLNLDVDDLSLRSLSEGDNSVFSEGVTPVEPCPDRGVSDNESEEVDDIELIFTTDESKDMSNLQEDLVSIRDTDQWAPSSASTHSTPVLIKFHTLDPDFQPRSEFPSGETTRIQNVIAGSSLRMKRVSLPSDKDIRRVAFNGKDSLDLPGRSILKSYDNRSDNTLYKRSPNTSTRRLDSVDSLTCEYNRAQSFDNTKSSSFELGSSMDMLQKEESVDSFHRGANLGHRFSVFAETDLTKCGISEDDLAGNLNIRRNTCPNPFQYRPQARGPRIIPRGVRPVLRGGGGARRDGAAQTDLSALPERWTSDGHLAYKPTPLPTLPQRIPEGGGMTGMGRLAVPARGGRRGDDTRRLLLSDLGFTSMVPELSRSADPVWALGRLAADASPSPQPSYTSKFLSRGPSLSTDRSYDWTQRACFSPMCGSGMRSCAGSLPDVRVPLADPPTRTRSVHTLACHDYYSEPLEMSEGRPFVPASPAQLRPGLPVRLIAPNGRLAQGRIRYVGIAGGSAANSSIMIGAEFPSAQYPGLPRNDGIYKGRRYFLTPPQYTALFVPFTKVVMAWAN